MTYRELLEKCKNNSGCLGTREQMDLDSKIRYQIWKALSNEKNKKTKK